MVTECNYTNIILNYTYTKGHNEVCKAKYAKCKSCQQIGHYANCCMRDGKFLKKDKGKEDNTLLLHMNRMTCNLMKTEMLNTNPLNTCCPLQKENRS